MSTSDNQYRFKRLPSGIQARLLALPTLLAKNDVLLANLFGSLVPGGAVNGVDLALLTRARPAYELREVFISGLSTERVDLIDLSG